MKKNLIKCLALAAIPAAGLALASIAVPGCSSPAKAETTSPDGRLRLSVGVTPSGRVFYTLRADGQTVVDTSYVSIDMREGAVGRASKVASVSHSAFDETWSLPWGEESEVRNHYNEMRVDLTEDGSDVKNYSLVFRLFDDGLGFRYEIPRQASLDSVTILNEDSQFRISEDAVAWAQPAGPEYYEYLYKPSPLSRLDTVSTPLTMKVTDNLYLSIHESNIIDYAEMNLCPDSATTTLHSCLTPWSTGEKVFAALPLATPWRTVTVAASPGDLALSRLTLNLADPCKIEDTSWIEPGRYVGIWWGMHMKDWTWSSGPKHGATTENAKRYIDFAAENGYSGVLVEGWNKGWDGDWTANGDKFSFTEAYPDFDIAEVAAYARSKGVRLIGHNETAGGARNYESQLDSAFALYQRLGMNMVKTGYVNHYLDGRELHGSQYGVRHYRKVIETAAKYHIMICNHEGLMPNGWRRTYPNIMAHEDMRGQEYDAWSPDGGNPPEHTCTLPFTRGLAGPMDFTPGTFNFNNTATPGTRPQTTIAKQLALAVVIYSPVVMSSDKVENYVGRPEFEFLKRCPTNWARTVFPEARIGEYVTVARKERDGESWYLGSITNANPHDSEVKLDFLDPGRTYTARVFADGAKADYKTNPYPVVISDRNVTADETLRLHLAPGGGAAVILTPVGENLAKR